MGGYVGHAKHALLPAASSKNCPASQVKQSSGPTAPTPFTMLVLCHAAQLLHVVHPTPAEKVPVGHAMQLVLPARFWYCPGKQGLQTAPLRASGPMVPAGHTEHAVPPTAD